MLHMVNKSPFERNNLESCLRLAKKGSAVLLIEDCVVAAMQNTSFAEKVEAASKEFKLFVLGPDLAARGLVEEKVIEGISIVDYAGFVDLTEEHGTVQSWL